MTKEDLMDALSEFTESFQFSQATIELYIPITITLSRTDEVNKMRKDELIELIYARAVAAIRPKDWSKL